MSFSYQEELLNNADNVEKTEDGKYLVKCPWCNDKFKSDDFLKAVNREGVHRSKQHIQEEGKIPKPENGRNKKTSIVEEWIENLEQKNGEEVEDSSSVETVLKIAQTNYRNREKLV